MSMREMIARALYGRTIGEVNKSFPDQTPKAWGALSDNQRAGWLVDADAVLAVLREPTPEMMRAVDDEDSDPMVARGRAYSAWTIMIDAAISEGMVRAEEER